MLHGGADPNHINEAVHGSDFVEMHVVSWNAVNGRFGVSERGKHRQHPVLQ